MDDFNKYEELRERGLGPHEVYQVARTDGFDLITSIRLLRKVFGLSLAEAKEASRMLDVLNTKQKLVPGGTVYWEAPRVRRASTLWKLVSRASPMDWSILRDTRSIISRTVGLKKHRPDCE